MASTECINGDNFYLSLDGNRIAFSQGATLDLSTNLFDATSKDSGGNVNVKPGNRSHTLTANGIIDFAKTFGHEGFIDAHIARSQLSFEFTTGASGDFKITGNCYIESYTIDTPQGDLVTYSATMQVDGAITKTAI